jgi:hypothetical protein
VGSPQTLSEADRRIVAVWAADCAERVLGLFEAEAPGDSRPRDTVARLRGADALGAAAYAASAAGLAAPNRPEAVTDEIRWQLERVSVQARAARRELPPVGENPAGPLRPGLLASGVLGAIIRELQVSLAAPAVASAQTAAGAGR